MRPAPRLLDQDGTAAIVATLALLTLVGIASFAALRVAGTEAAMAGNETTHQRNFYLAEAAVVEAVDILDNTVDLHGEAIDWLEREPGRLTTDTLSDYWKRIEDPAAGVTPSPSKVDPGHTLFVAAEEGVAEGASLVMGRSAVHEFSIYGRCAQHGVSVVKVGYRGAY
jgi:hypothetical protein